MRINNGKESQIKIKNNIKTLRKEIDHNVYKNKIPFSTPAKHENKMTLNSIKRNPPGIAAGSNILGSIPSANKNMQLQGYTIKPDSKFTSLAEVHKRGYFPRKNY